MFVRLKLSENGSRDAMATPFTPGIASMRRADFAPVLLAALRRVAQHAGVRRDDREPVGREADIGFLRGDEAADEQPGRHEQHDGHRHLSDDQHVAHCPADVPTAAGAARDVALQIADQVGRRRAQRRRESGENAGQQRDAGGKAEDARVEPEVERQRNRDRQLERRQQPRQPGGEQRRRRRRRARRARGSRSAAGEPAVREAAPTARRMAISR